MAPVARLHHIPEGWSQHKQRAIKFYYDQHKSATFRDADGKAIHEFGRPYWAWVERPALNERRGLAVPMPVGPIMPAGWQAPFYAPDKFIVRSIGRVGSDGGWLQGMATSEYFSIDYGSMAHEDGESMKEYYQRAVLEAARLNLPTPDYGAILPFNLMVIVGRAPRSPKIAEACMAGNDWILGQRMPTTDPATGQRRVVPDKMLARLLKMSNTDLMTPDEASDLAIQKEQAEEQESAALALLREQADLITLLRADMAAMKADAEERAEKAKKAAERMQNARNAKGKKPAKDTKVTSETAKAG